MFKKLMREIKMFVVKGKERKNSNINSTLGQNGIKINIFNEKMKKILEKYKNKDVIRVLIKLKEKNKIKIIDKGIKTAFLIKKFMFEEKKKNLINKEGIKNVIKNKIDVFNTKNKKKIFRIILGTVKSLNIKYVN